MINNNNDSSDLYNFNDDDHGNSNSIGTVDDEDFGVQDVHYDFMDKSSIFHVYNDVFQVDEMILEG